MFIFAALLLTQTVFAMEKDSQTMGNVIGKSVNVYQRNSGSEMNTGNILSEGEVKVHQEATESYGLEFTRTDKDINGDFWGYEINSSDIQLKTTKNSIIYQGQTYPYDGQSKCFIKDSKLIVGCSEGFISNNQSSLWPKAVKICDHWCICFRCYLLCRTTYNTFIAKTIDTYSISS